MIIFKTVAALRQQLRKLTGRQQSIGFVPTMGALHAGHLSLVQHCRQQTDVCVVSIFVNPTQFNDPKDFEKYPVTLEQDCRLLEAAGTAILFLPSVAEMYPEGTGPAVPTPLGELEHLLEGRYRPGHFQGVCQVVRKLLQVVEPDRLFLGQKDYQQCMVLQRLVQQMATGTTVVIVPTMREADGLAMSSRNMRLRSEERAQATAIYQALTGIRERFLQAPAAELEQEATRHLLAAGFSKVDYVSIADAATLQPFDPEKNGKAVALVAAFIGEVRLIDNLLLN